MAIFGEVLQIGARIFGSRFGDDITGDGADNRIFAGPGDDTVDAGEGDDRVLGGLGDDEIDGGPGDDDLFGGPGGDELTGGTGADDVSGGLGADRIFSDGVDDIDGGFASDTTDFSEAGAGVFVDLAAGITAPVTILNDGSVDLPEPDALGSPPFALDNGVSRISNQVVNVLGSVPGPVDADLITFTVAEGSELTQLILPEFVSADNLGFIALQEGREFTVDLFPDVDGVGNDGGDALSELIGGANFGIGPDVNGLAGSNILPALLAGGGLEPLADLESDGFVDALPTGTYTLLVQQIGGSTIDYSLDFVVQATGDATAGFGTIESIETVIGTDGIDVITGTDAGETLEGGDAGDVLVGNGGADQLVGGAGDDIVFSDAVDTVFGGTGVDTIDFLELGEGVIIDLDINSAAGAGTPSEEGAVLDAPPAAGGAPIVEINDVENVFGTGFDDVLFGNNEVNLLLGREGDDTIHSFAGADTLDGGDGNDTALFTAGPAVTVDLDDAGDATSSAGDTLISIENLTGSATGDDVLSGNALANSLVGNGGDDTLAGEGGDDILTTGEGADIIEGGTVGIGEAGNDVVTDFTIDVDTFGFDFDGSTFSLSSTDSFLELADLLETDGDDATSALIDGADATFDFGAGDSVLFEDVGGTIAVESLVTDGSETAV